MHVSFLSLTDFRSYPSLELALEPGITTLIGPNGQGKTNLVEAIGYAAALGSHRVASDAPLVRLGAQRAVVRVAVVRGGRQVLVEIEIVPGGANRARVNRSPVPRPREVLGLVRAVLSAPEDLAIVKGDPAQRRGFLDELLVARTPRLAGVRADYDRVLRQRNVLLKTAGSRARGGGGDLRTLEVWDAHLAKTGAQLLAARLELVDILRPLLAKAYDALVVGARADSPGLDYRSSLGPDVALVADANMLEPALLAAMAGQRRAELDRGMSLIGPHRDDVVLKLGPLPARGYASQGESWSLALALRLSAYDLLRSDGGEPVLILDDVFAELDDLRRERLAEAVAGAGQVLITAAVATDVPAALNGARVEVRAGSVRRVGP